MTPQFTDQELQCDEAAGLLEAFVDGELEPELAARLRRHLEGCPECALELQLAERIGRGLRALPELDPPPAILARVREIAVGSRDQGDGRVVPFGPPPARHTASRTRRWVMGALAAALVGLLAAALVERMSAPAAPSQAQVQSAERQARFALAYIGRVTRQASLTLRDDVLEKRVVLPARLSIERPLDPSVGRLLDHREPKGI